MVPGNVVFVLQKGADNWASVVFNERVRRAQLTLTLTLTLKPPMVLILGRQIPE